MSKKIIQVLLVIGVILVWGLVIYRMVGSASNELVYDMQSAPINSLKAPDVNYMDSTLILNYADPFLRQSTAHTRAVVISHSDKPIKAKPSKEVKPPSVTEVWPEIKYKGLITNRNSGVLLGIISIGNEEKIVKQGDIVSGFSVMQIAKTSATFKSSNGTLKIFNIK